MEKGCKAVVLFLLLLLMFIYCMHLVEMKLPLGTEANQLSKACKHTVRKALREFMIAIHVKASGPQSASRA